MNRPELYPCARLKPLSFALILFISGLPPVSAQVTPDAGGTVYVNHQANGNGSSWGQAVRQLSVALAAAHTNTSIRTIRIAQGTYYPTGTQNGTDRTVSFAINRGGLKLYGGYNAATGQRNIQNHPTILSGNIGNASNSADNSYHVLAIRGLAANADSVVIDGLTIRDGMANNKDNEDFGRGGGIIIENCLNEWKVAVRNSAIVMNTAGHQGGGAWLNGSSVKFTNCRFEDNRSVGNESEDFEIEYRGDGGGLAVIGASAEVLNSVFLINSAAGGGGGLYGDEASLKIGNTDFDGNKAVYQGGAIRNYYFSENLIISNCDFDNNVAEYGGAISNSFGSIDIRNSNFSQNESTNDGGAIDNNGLWDNSIISNCNFTHNFTKKNGGALANYSSYVNIDSCTFLENKTTDGLGGAIFNQGFYEKSRIEACVFNRNSAKEGGAVYNEYLENGSIITDCNFNENSARNGGAIFNYRTAVVRYCEFNKNRATENGGAIYSQSEDGYGERITVLGCNFNDNSAGYYGGACNNFIALVDIRECGFFRNTAGQNGGAMTNIGLLENSIIRDSHFEENKSSDLGGAMTIFLSDVARVINCSFKGNESVGLGGAFVVQDCPSALIENSLFSGNYSGNNGSGLVVSKSDARVVNCTFAANNTAGGGTVTSMNESSLEVLNSIILFNGSAQGSGGLEKGATSSIRVGYSTSQGYQDIFGEEGILNWSFVSTSAFRDIPAFNTAPTTAGDFRPLATPVSVINRGNNSLLSSDITGDLAGLSRIRSGIVDLGAYEFQGVPYNLSELYVDRAATGAGTGATWTNAITTLSEALDLVKESAHVHTIHVARGTYYPTTGTDRDRAFVLPPRNIKLFGGYDPATGIRNPAATPAVLSGNIGSGLTRDDNSYHVMVIAGLGSDSTIVDGFTITGGAAEGSGSFSYNGLETYRDWGGGLFVTNETGTGKAVIRNCVILANTATTYGGGASNFNTSLVVVNSRFSGNKAGFGGGLSNIPKTGQTISPVVLQSTFAGNSATTRGGGIDNFNKSSLSLVNTLVYGNSSGLGGEATMTYTASHSLIQGRASIDNLDGTTDYPRVFENAYNHGYAPTTSGNYRLSENSPARDSGSDQSATGITTDLAFMPRIFGPRVDIGAYEFSCPGNVLPGNGELWNVEVAQFEDVLIGDLCNQIGRIGSPFLYGGNLGVRAWLAGEDVLIHGPARFVRRYHALIPNGAGGGTVTFYYSNSDFKAYNDAYGNVYNARLPDIDDEVPETGNLKVVRYSGSGSGDYLPGTYSGTWNILTPSEVVWEEEYDRWRVVFSTTSFSGFFVTGQRENALPVNLLSFKAARQENTVQLTWQTTEEKDFSHFDIECSPDARSWKPVGRVKGKAFSGDTDYGGYTFTDHSPLSTLAYYRLKMIDLDGTFSYSPIESVSFKDGTLLVNTYPNPSRRGITTLKVSGIFPTRIEVYDLAGRRTGICAEAEGKGLYTLNFSNASPGMYTVVVMHSSGMLTRKQVIKD